MHARTYVCLAECKPYSESACVTAAAALGLHLGSALNPFRGVYVTKGCFAFTADHPSAGSAFYSTGGSVQDMQETPFAYQYRPPKYDCAGKGKLCT